MPAPIKVAIVEDDNGIRQSPGATSKSHFPILETMPQFLLILLLCILLRFTGTNGYASEKTRPNIIVLMADDLGFSDIGAYGGEIDTPNLDQLAANGLRYMQFHNATVCCPSRASLLTGLYPHQAGMGGMNHRKLDHPAYRGQLRDDVPTIAEALRTKDYATWMVGKWHLTWSDTIKDGPNGSWPWQRGFQNTYITMEGAKDYFEPTWLFDGEREVKTFPKDYYYERAISTRAADWIRNHEGEQPFFLYVAFYAPHFPLQAPESKIEKYRDRYGVGWDVLREKRLQRQIASGLLPKGTKLSPRTPNVPAWETLSKDEQYQLARRMAVYAAQVDELDQAVGRVVRALKETRQLENTVIFFLSDNGAGSRGGVHGQGKPEELNARGVLSSTYGSGWSNLSNTPFRRYKMEAHAGGNTAPLIVHWPRQVREAGVRRQIVHIMDIMPTCLDLAGAERPARGDQAPPPLPGRSLLPTFHKDETIDRNLFWEYNGSRAVRSGNWKLVALNRKSAWELYEVKKDPTETRNLVKQRPDKARELEQLWQQWADANGVSLLK